MMKLKTAVATAPHRLVELENNRVMIEKNLNFLETLASDYVNWKSLHDTAILIRYRSELEEQQFQLDDTHRMLAEVKPK
jgi:hypothetical protein